VERSPRKILVIQTAFLGDIVLTTPFLANLRELAPGAEIRLLTTPVGARVLTPNGFGIELISYDKRGHDAGFGGIVRLARELRAWRPDLVFCLHRSLRSALLAKLSGGEIYGFREAAGSALFAHRVDRPAGLFEAEKNQKLLETWAGNDAKSQPVFPVLATSTEDEREADALLGGMGSFVAIAPSSVWATKRWPADRFARVAAGLWKSKGLRAVIVGGREPEDIECAGKVAASFRAIAPDAPPPLDLAGKTGLGTLKSVLSRAKLAVANDSAPLHVAIAMGVPVVGVFGPTVKEIGFFPNAPKGKAAAVEVAGLDCRPCGLHGHHECPKGHFRCMLDLDPGAVLREAERLL
jgi:heptosyltransferase-2